MTIEQEQQVVAQTSVQGEERDLETQLGIKQNEIRELTSNNCLLNQQIQQIEETELTDDLTYEQKFNQIEDLNNQKLNNDEKIAIFRGEFLELERKIYVRKSRLREERERLERAAVAALSFNTNVEEGSSNLPTSELSPTVQVGENVRLSPLGDQGQGSINNELPVQAFVNQNQVNESLGDRWERSKKIIAAIVVLLGFIAAVATLVTTVIKIVYKQ